MMRVPGWAVAGVLALTAPAAVYAVPLGSSMEQLAPEPSIVTVWGDCGWGWYPAPGHWSRWRGGWWVPSHCAPHRYYRRWVPYDGWGNANGWGGRHGPYDDWGALSYPYRAWRGPSRGWGDP